MLNSDGDYSASQIVYSSIHLLFAVRLIFKL